MLLIPSAKNHSGRNDSYRPSTRDHDESDITNELHNLQSIGMMGGLANRPQTQGNSMISNFQKRMYHLKKN